MRDGKPMTGAFDPHNGGTSVDWDKYSTPEQTRARAKRPELNAVVRMGVGEIRGVDDALDVIHRPLPDNQAHSEIPLPDEGPAQSELRVKLTRIAVVVIPLSA